MKTAGAYDAHETDRMQMLHGTPLAPFARRAVAFIPDFLVAWALFLGILLPGGMLAARMGLVTGDVNLKFHFSH